MVMTFLIHPRFALIFLVVIVCLAAVLALISSRANPTLRRVFHEYDELNARVQENVNGMRVVKSFVREEYETGRFETESEKIRGLFVSAEKLLALNSPVMQFSMYSCILLISWMGAKMIIAGSLTEGQLMSMFTYVINILMSLMMVSMTFVMLIMSRASGERISEVLAEEPDLYSVPHGVKEVPDGSIDFEQVGFAYPSNPGKEVLNDLTIHIRPGETIGILGGTGSAKSSFAALIPRLYDATRGEVRVGGIPVKDYDMASLRDNVAMVLQKNVLFSGTIKENLRWGKEDATDEEIVRACRLAQADEFIRDFPSGYDTRMERGGANVSGGQKQRLCIARALLKKPKILILDDSTSAVDTKTDALIRRAFREEIPDTTKIVIAQRISSIQDADRILVFDNGRMEAAGTHEELLGSCPVYREIYESQTRRTIMENSNYLGTERVGKLLRQFAIPCICSLIISCLYNIVDQIFVGNGVGYLGNAATGVIFPITVVGWGLSLFFGDGAAAALSVSLGRGETKKVWRRLRLWRGYPPGGIRGHYEALPDRAEYCHRHRCGRTADRGL